MIDLDSIPQVALDFVNHDHRLMGEQVNRLMAQCTRYEQGEAAREDITDTLEILCQHTAEHFGREEEQMRAFRFIHYTFHKNGHDKVIAEMRGELAAWRCGGDFNRLKNYVFNLVPNWIMGHVEVQDAEMASYIARVSDRAATPRVEYMGATPRGAQ